MHSVNERVLQSGYFSSDFLFQGYVIFNFLLVLSVPMTFAEVNFLLSFLIFSLFAGLNYFVYNRYNKFKSFVNSKDQLNPDDAIDQFYSWEKGDKIEIPQRDGYAINIKGEYIGCKDDGSIVLDLSNLSSNPTKDINGYEIPENLSYYEIPPNFLKL